MNTKEPWPENLYKYLAHHTDFTVDYMTAQLSTNVPIFERWGLEQIFKHSMSPAKLYSQYPKNSITKAGIISRIADDLVKLDSYLTGKTIPMAYKGSITVTRCARLPYPLNIALGAFNNDSHFDVITPELVETFLDGHCAGGNPADRTLFLAVFKNGTAIKDAFDNFGQVCGCDTTHMLEQHIFSILNTFKTFILTQRPAAPVQASSPTTRTAPAVDSDGASFVMNLNSSFCAMSLNGIEDLTQMCANYPKDVIHKVLVKLENDGYTKFERTGEPINSEMWQLAVSLKNKYDTDNLSALQRYLNT